MLCKPFQIRKPRAAQFKWIQVQTVTSPRNTPYLSKKELHAPALKSPWLFGPQLFITEKSVPKLVEVFKLAPGLRAEVSISQLSVSHTFCSHGHL